MEEEDPTEPNLTRCDTVMKLRLVHEAPSCAAFTYLDSVGPRSDVLKDACSSGLVHILHTENLEHSARPACVLF